MTGGALRESYGETGRLLPLWSGGSPMIDIISALGHACKGRWREREDQFDFVRATDVALARPPSAHRGGRSPASLNLGWSPVRPSRVWGLSLPPTTPRSSHLSTVRHIRVESIVRTV